MDADTIRRLARDFSAAQAPVVYGRMGVSVQRFGTLCQYLIMLINILCGRLDAPGGLMFTHPAVDILKHSGRGHMGRYRSRVRGLPEFGGELPVATLAEEILSPGEGQIRAMLLSAGNPVLSTPNGEQLDRAFAQLDFMVAIDFYLNESNRHADIILPPVSPLEREHYDVVFHVLAVRNTTRYAPALFEAPPDARHDWQIMLDLRDRLVPATNWREKARRAFTRKLGPAGSLDLLLRGGPYGGGLNPLRGLNLRRVRRALHGIDLGPLRPALPGALFHRDARVHLSAEFFLDDLQRVESQFFGPPQNAEQMLLIGRRHVRSNNTWLHNSQRLVKGKPRCVALLHPRDAERMGLNGGGRVQVRSATGCIDIEAQTSEEMMPGVISIPHGWGHDKPGTGWKTAEAHAGVSVNVLTDEAQLDEFSGNAALNGVPVEVSATA